MNKIEEYWKTFYSYANISIFGIHLLVLVGIAVAFILALCLRKPVRNLLVHLIWKLEVAAIDLEPFKKDVLALMYAPMIWLSTVMALAIVFFISDDVRQNTALALAIRIFLYVYVFYILIKLSNLLGYFIPNSIIQHQILLGAIIKFVKVMLILTCAIMILGMCGFNTSALLASLGLGGAAIALAIKSIIENVISGMVILIERPFEVGDYISVGTIAEGSVIDLRLHYTELELEDKTHILVPNTLTLNNSIVNHSKAQFRPIVMDFYLYWEETSPDQLKKLEDDITTYIRRTPLLVEQMSSVSPTTAPDGRFNLHVATYSHISNTNIAQVQSDLFANCKSIFNENGIAFAMPRHQTQTVTLVGD